MDEIRIEDQYIDIRIDKVLPILLKEFTRSEIVTLIDENHVLVNNKAIKPSYKLKKDDVISVEIPKPKSSDIKGEDIKLDIVYEDDDVIIVNKEQGMVVHPACGHNEGTLVNALINHTKNLSIIGGVTRPGIVHRIDKDTSGLICVAKNDYAHHFLSEQLKDHTMHREYYALVKGHFIEREGKINLPIERSKTDRQKMAVSSSGKPSITYFKVIKEFKDHTLLSLKLETGRTHQIRVHLSYINHPIEGDNIYGHKPFLYKNGQMLHAYQLTFIHPTTKKEVTFTSSLPTWFNDFLTNLN